MRAAPAPVPDPGLGAKAFVTAKSLIAMHGSDAPLYALQSADLLRERGDFKGASQWHLVWRAVEDLLSSGVALPEELGRGANPRVS